MEIFKKHIDEIENGKNISINYLILCRFHEGKHTDSFLEIQQFELVLDRHVGVTCAVKMQSRLVREDGPLDVGRPNNPTGKTVGPNVNQTFSTVNRPQVVSNHREKQLKISII